MPDKPTPWEAFQLAGKLTVAQLKVVIMIMREFLKDRGR